MRIKPITVGMLESNSYLLVDESTGCAVLIDPGDEPNRLIRAIESEGAELRRLLLTHGHPDHSWAAGQIQEMFPQAELLMHESDVIQLHGDPHIVELFFDMESYAEPKLGRFLNDGDEISFGESRLRAIHTPGHTEGGLCFAADNVVFTGDTLFAGSVGRTDLMGGSFEKLIHSIKTKLLTLPDKTIIYPGHGEPSTIGIERRSNPWLSE